MPATPLRPSTRVSAACFLAAGLWFCTGCFFLSLAANDVVVFFYQPRPLAITHCFTLGWTSSMIMGVLYQYVPALTKQRLLWPRLSGWLVFFYEFGVSGLVAHFWIAHYNGMAWSAGMIAASVLLFVAQLAVPLLRAPNKDATVIGIGAALLCFAGTATLGFLYGINRLYPFLGGSTLGNLAAHADLGMLGWMALTICAVSYRMVAAFSWPTEVIPVAARRQIVSLAVLVPCLVVSQLLGSPLATLFGLLTGANFLWHGVNLWQLLRTRRLPIDWSIAHLLAGFGCLLGAGACGLTLLLFTQAVSRISSRLVVAYGVLLLVGWVTNTIIGIGTRMLPGLIGLGPAPLLPNSWRVALFVLLNLGVLAIVGSVGVGSADVLRIAAWAPLLTGLVFAVALLQRTRRQPA